MRYMTGTKVSAVQSKQRRTSLKFYMMAASVFSVLLLLSDELADGELKIHAMHIMEGYLPAGWCVAWGALCIPFVIIGTASLKRKIEDNGRVKLLIALSAAFVFIVSSLKIPSVTGSCSHATGTGLGAMMFGPSVMSVISIIVLIFQALLLAHGGVTTLGANTFSMGIAGPFVSYGIFRLLKNTKVPVNFTVFLSAFVGDIVTYIVTSFQLSSAYPGEDAVSSFFKFFLVFVPTQIPVAAVEGLLTVIVYGIVHKNCPKELKKISGSPEYKENGRKLASMNMLFAAGIVILAAVPLMLLGNDTEFGGSDDAGSAVVDELTGDQGAWFESLWEPPSSEIESLIFCVQSALGAGICGFVLGRISGKNDESKPKHDDNG